MTTKALVLGYFGDTAAADAAAINLRSANFRNVVTISKSLSGDFSLKLPQNATAAWATGGAIVGFAVSRLLPLPQVGRFMPVLGGACGALLGVRLEISRRGDLDAQQLLALQRSLSKGETLVIVQAAGRELAHALSILRDGEKGPTTFILRSGLMAQAEEVGNARSDVLALEPLKESMVALALSHQKVVPTRGAKLLGRLQESRAIIFNVVRGLGEAVKLEQSVSLSAEWLLDNNYIIQGQIADVQHNLTRHFLEELPALVEGDSAGVPRIYALAQELVTATDSRLDRQHITDPVHVYQQVTPLTTGELWALPLMLRLALVENLRRLTANLDLRQRERERADLWANRLLSAGLREPDQLLPLLADLSLQQRQIVPHFAERLVSHLFDEEAALGPVRTWLERKLEAPLHEVTGSEQKRQAADGVSIANIITSLRYLANLDWRECFEELSLIDQILAQDPAGVYRSMDFDSRNRYRSQVEKIARRTKADELEVARKVVHVASEANRERVRAATVGHDVEEHARIIYQPNGHVGYYLVDDGLAQLEDLVGYRNSLPVQTQNWLRKHPDVWYYGGVAAGTMTAMVTLGRFTRLLGGRLPLPLAVLSLLPATEIALQVVNYLSNRFTPPRPLPKMDFEGGIPDRWKTAIVIPTLFSSEAEARQVVHQLELHYLASPDPNLRFAVLADYADAASSHTTEDAELLAAAIDEINKLNRRYPDNKFSLFIRNRRWSETEERWMGWERKRGKLEEFNAYLCGRYSGELNAMHLVAGDAAALHGVSLVITLDADTQLPYGASLRLIETSAHPLNRPILSADVEFGGVNTPRVLRGYTLIQPRVDASLPSATATRFARIFTSAEGSDPYTQVISDLYQDVFREGSSHGKGLYDLQTFDAVLHRRFPDATLLSHDLLEGGYVRVGLASDIQLLDQFPPHYMAYSKRAHRWIRGDWQIMGWLLPRVPAADGGWTPNPLSLLNKWKVKDNLRRSLLAPSSLGMLLGGWFLGPVPAVSASIGIAGLILWPTAISLFTRLTTQPDSLMRGRYEVSLNLARAAVSTSLLLHQGGQALDAIVRVFYRRFISHKLMLEWQTAASTFGGAGTQEVAFLLRLGAGSAFAGGIALALAIWGSPMALVAASPYLLAWAAAPLLVKWMSSPTDQATLEALSPADTAYLRQVARQTWRYYDDFVGPQTNWLPPDNYQEALTVEIAQRTSPTNMGLWLLACVAAQDFGWLPLDEVISRTGSALESFHEMEKHEGHLLNWYNSLTLEPLHPRYVSTVDSGNLLGSLWTLVHSMEELAEKPLFSVEILQGLEDVLALLEGALGSDQATLLEEMRVVRAQLAVRPDSASTLVTYLRQLAHPVGILSRTLSMRMLPRKSSARARAELNSAATDPRFMISASSYWAAQLETQLDLWLQQVERYGKWLELLQQPGDDFLRGLGADAMGLRRRILAQSPTLDGLGRGQLPELQEFLRRRDRPNLAEEVVAWLDAVAVEYGRSRWLAGEMLASARTVIDEAQGLADAMNMSFLYDEGRQLFSIGYNVEDRRLDGSFYDLLASECRLASFCSVARGDVPAEHWIALGRRFGSTPVGPALMSWSGTMFEYLMPHLFQKRFDNSLLDKAMKVAVESQIVYGNRRGVPWGISEAAYAALDASRIYQYKAFGVPYLGLKRGLEDDLVVAPYASLMALMVNRDAALANLKRLEGMGARGDYGFYESIDFTRERLEEDSMAKSEVGETPTAGGRKRSETQRGAIVRCFMVHHQGMGLLALQNVLCDGAVQRRFHADVMVEAAEPLLYEKIPEAPPVLDQGFQESARPTRTLGPGMAVERNQTADTQVPRAHLLGSEGFHVMATAAGSGYIRWGEFEITRWRADTTRDNWGEFLYLKDAETGQTWSSSHQPLKRPARRSHISFKAEKVEYERRDSEIETRVEVCVSPEDNCEIRRVTLINHSSRTRTVELTSYMELALAAHAADRAHPAFNKLFIETDVVKERGALLAWRRLRSLTDTPVWAGHWICSQDRERAIQWETDRSRFLGRGRSAENPMAMEGSLSGTTGAVLDPCFALRTTVVLESGERHQMAFLTAAGSSREDMQRLFEKYGDFAACERGFDLAWTHSQLELHHHRVRADEAQAFQQLVGYMVYPHAALRAPARRLRENQKGQSGLWAYGISGDLPIMVVAIDNERDIPVVRQAIMAHTFWRVRGFKSDLIIINEQSGGYSQDLTETLRKLITNSTPYTGVDCPGGVFLCTTDTMPEEDITLILSVARVVLVAARGPIVQQMGMVNDDTESLARFAPHTKEVAEWVPNLPFLELPYFNGLGGFTPDGREYAIYMGPGTRTPAPWINVFAHESFGTVVSEAGQGFSWFGNSQSNRLNPWSNDPVSDTPTEAIYLRDEDTAAIWSPTPLPIREQEAYRARHGQGYSVFEHNSHGLEQELTTFVPLGMADANGNELPVKVLRLVLRNRTQRKRRILATYSCDLVMGTTREENQMHLISSWDTQSKSLIVRNSYRPDFSERLVFASSNPSPDFHCADRAAFLGRNGSPASPMALRYKSVQEKLGAGLDPCVVLQVALELQPEEEKVVSFFLGEAQSVEEIRSILARLGEDSQVRGALETTTGWWDNMLGKLQVDVPDASVNYLLNRWLPYQTLSCRIWARSAFYQSGGAWGFRDQLQDSLALTTLKPAVARQQILRSAAHQFEEGDVQHWWHPPGDAGVRTRITDDLLFLPYAVAQYVKVTGDVSVLDEVVPFLHADVLEDHEHEKYFQPQVSSESATLFEHCKRAIEKGATRGVHGLPLIGGGDWNDGLNRVGIEGKGESVWLGWFLVHVLQEFSDLCKSSGHVDLARTYRARARDYNKQLDAHAWDGEWYLRGFFDDGTPLGSSNSEEMKIDSLPQSWSVIAGGGNAERSEKAMSAVEKILVREAEKMVLLFTPAFDQTDTDPGYIKGYLPGVRENGGQYTHAACWVAYALARSGRGAKAVEVLGMLNPVEHARTREETDLYKVEPYVVAADVYALKDQMGRGGWTWYTGSCGWMYRVWIEEVLGWKKLGSKVKLDPSVPPHWTNFKLTYREGDATYHIVVNNPDGVEKGVVRVEMDGKVLRNGEISLLDDGATHEVVVTMGHKAERKTNQELSAPAPPALPPAAETVS